MDNDDGRCGVDDDAVDPATWVSLGLAVFSLLIAFFTCFSDRPHARLVRDQDAKMRLVAARAIVFYEYRNHDTTQTTGPDSPFAKAVQSDAKKLEQALYDAIGVGLWKDLVGPKETATALFIRSVQRLSWVYSQNLAEPLHTYDENTELFHGIVRIIDRCGVYEEHRDNKAKAWCQHREGPSLKSELRKAVSKESPSLKEAWAELDQQPAPAP